jgi:hypothetical protein
LLPIGTLSPLAGILPVGRSGLVRLFGGRSRFLDLRCPCGALGRGISIIVFLAQLAQHRRGIM